MRQFSTTTCACVSLSNQIELAGDELEKGPGSRAAASVVAHVGGIPANANSHLTEAIEILEGSSATHELMRIAVPTLALCYVQAGNRARAAALLKDDTLAAAEADSEMAYRLGDLLCR